MNLRRGIPEDIQRLELIAFAAKAHWGYSAEQLEAWRADLTISPESFIARPVCVAEEDGQPVGFVQVAMDKQPWELDALWVYPEHMGKGIGKALFTWAQDLAALSGQLELAIDADPNAERFYRACGAVLVGSVPAPIVGNPHRVRPQLLVRTSAA